MSDTIHSDDLNAAWSVLAGPDDTRATINRSHLQAALLAYRRSKLEREAKVWHAGLKQLQSQPDRE